MKTEQRLSYERAFLEESQTETCPFAQFDVWFKQALSSDIPEPYAMVLGTLNHHQTPANIHMRVVLMRAYDEQGIVFFTNYLSQKGQDLTFRPQASLLFFWQTLEQQIRIEGQIERLDETASDEYFQTRPLGSKIGAWASPQSQPISREALDDRFKYYKKKWQEQGQNHVPRPSHWGGYRLKPHYFEFWQGRASRLHDRLVYRQIPKDNTTLWHRERLAP